MKYYVKVKHPITGEEVVGVPTGKQNDLKIEIQVITPQSNLDKLWITRKEIIV